MLQPSPPTSSLRSGVINEPSAPSPTELEQLIVTGERLCSKSAGLVELRAMQAAVQHFLKRMDFLLSPRAQLLPLRRALSVMVLGAGQALKAMGVYAAPDNFRVVMLKDKAEEVREGYDMHCVCRTNVEDDSFMLQCGTQQRSSSRFGLVSSSCSFLCLRALLDAACFLRADTCQGWYHGVCVNVSRSRAAVATRYTCPTCCEVHGSPYTFRDVVFKTNEPLVEDIKQAVNTLEAVIVKDGLVSPPRVK